MPPPPFQSADLNDAAADLLRKTAERSLIVGVIGLGYVGLPVVVAFGSRRVRVIGFDVDAEKIRQLNEGRSYIRQIASAVIAAQTTDGRFHATDDFARLTECDAIIICVPTPLTRHREPDLQYIEGTGRTLSRHLRRGQLVVLESTTYPGTTQDVLIPILGESGLRCGTDFWVGFSPEREDPGNQQYSLGTMPKVIGADDPIALEAMAQLYGLIVPRVVPLSSSRTAEAVKLTENIFRSVNIALVNELKLVYTAMNIDVWEVIDAAATKPFGYMPFYPGPGLGGHCIPIDPFYLTWKAREYEITPKFIELAGEINTAMPDHVVDVTVKSLSLRRRKGVTGANILVVGVAYKKNVEDVRESPALKIMTRLVALGAHIAYIDPFVPYLPRTRSFPTLSGLASIANDADFSIYDTAIICTDHDAFDYNLLVQTCPLVIDTRNAIARAGVQGENVVKA